MSTIVGLRFRVIDTVLGAEYPSPEKASLLGYTRTLTMISPKALKVTYLAPQL